MQNGVEKQEKTMRFNTHSQTTKRGAYHENTHDGEIDVFVVRIQKNDEDLLDTHPRGTEQKMELRFEAQVETSIDQLGEKSTSFAGRYHLNVKDSKAPR